MKIIKILNDGIVKKSLSLGKYILKLIIICQMTFMPVFAGPERIVDIGGSPALITHQHPVRIIMGNQTFNINEFATFHNHINNVYLTELPVELEYVNPKRLEILYDHSDLRRRTTPISRSVYNNINWNVLTENMHVNSGFRLRLRQNRLRIRFNNPLTAIPYFSVQAGKHTHYYVHAAIEGSMNAVVQGFLTAARLHGDYRQFTMEGLRRFNLVDVNTADVSHITIFNPFTVDGGNTRMLCSAMHSNKEMLDAIRNGEREAERTLSVRRHNNVGDIDETMQPYLNRATEEFIDNELGHESSVESEDDSESGGGGDDDHSDHHHPHYPMLAEEPIELEEGEIPPERIMERERIPEDRRVGGMEEEEEELQNPLDRNFDMHEWYYLIGKYHQLIAYFRIF